MTSPPTPSDDKVVVVSTGVANLASVLAALRRCELVPVTSEDPALVADAARVVLPGVGCFGAAMQRLRERRLDRALVARIEAGRPLLAICLGLQLLAQRSEESPGVPGLGVLPVDVVAMRGAPSLPQFGWNDVHVQGASLLEGGFAYFANSYSLEAIPDGFAGGVTDHGGPRVAAVERHSLVAVQFHPELSGAYGARLIERWARTC